MKIGKIERDNWVWRILEIKEIDRYRNRPGELAP